MPHYFSKKQDSPINLAKITTRLRESTIELYTGSGVFSRKKIDKGTELLVNNAILKDGWDVLDLGCGYGVVGVVIAKLFKKSAVVMTDINERAVKIAKMNIKLNKLENAKAVRGNLYEKVSGKFDSVLVNPPQLAGRKICFEMIEGAKDFLKKEGTLQLVARHNKGGRVLSEKMEDIFGNVEAIAKKAGYRVYISKN